MQKILIGSIGYHNLSNHSIGPVLLPELQKIDWPDGVDLEEMNWGPIAIVQKFQTLQTPYQKIILLVAIERKERQIGDITVYRWMGGLPEEEMIQACIGDAVTGVISVENLLVIGEYFKIWPGEVYLVDVEPGPEQAGAEFTSEITNIIPDVIETIKGLVMTDDLSMKKFKELYGDIFILNS
jgi:hypothetical protein